MRTVWENGTGEAHIEIFTVKGDGTKVLLNDLANDGLPSYSATVGAPLEITAFSRDAAGNVTLVWNSVLNANYIIEFATSPDGVWQELEDGLEVQGTSSQVMVLATTIANVSTSDRVFLRIREL